MALDFGYESDTQSFVDLETKEVATKAIRDEMLSVDRNGNIIDSTATQQQTQINSKLDRRENRSQAALFIFLSVIMFALLAVIVYLNVKDLKLKYTGSAITVDCKEGTTLTGRYNGRSVEILYLNNNGSGKLTYKSDSGASISGTEVLKGCFLKDDNDNVYLIPLSKTLFSANINENITVYYYGDNMANARTLTSIWVWIGLYCILIPLLVLFVRSIYITLHKTKHTQV